MQVIRVELVRQEMLDTVGDQDFSGLAHHDEPDRLLIPVLVFGDRLSARATRGDGFVYVEVIGVSGNGEERMRMPG